MDTQQLTSESLTAILREFRETPAVEQTQLDRIVDDYNEQALKQSVLSRPDPFDTY
jgi:hypothetical protein